MSSSSRVSRLDSSGPAMDRPVDRTGVRRRRWALAGAAALGVLCVVGLILWLVPASGAVTVKADETEITPVRDMQFADYLPLRATAAPLTSTFVTAVDGGQVAKVLAQDGAEVAAGTPLAVLANPQLTLEVTAREAEISGRLGDSRAQELGLQQARAAREAEVADVNFKLLTARRELAKHQRLRELNLETDAAVAPFQDEETFESERLKTLQRQLAEEGAIRQAQAAQIRQTTARLNSNFEVVQASLGALMLRAPIAGRLTNFSLQPGQPLKAGDTVGQVDDEHAYKLLADIDEFYLGRIAPGQRASAELDGRPVALVVMRVLPQVTAGQFRAELGFVGRQPEGLKRGQSLDLRLTLGGARPALVLPNGPWIERSGGAWAFVLTSPGRAERRAITTGRRNPEQVEVLRGLRAGDRVVVSSYAGLEPYKHLLIR